MICMNKCAKNVKVKVRRPNMCKKSEFSVIMSLPSESVSACSGGGRLAFITIQLVFIT